MGASPDLAKWLRELGDRFTDSFAVTDLARLAAQQHEALKSVLVENDKVVAALRAAQEFKERYNE